MTPFLTLVQSLAIFAFLTLSVSAAPSPSAFTANTNVQALKSDELVAYVNGSLKIDDLMVDFDARSLTKRSTSGIFWSCLCGSAPKVVNKVGGVVACSNNAAISEGTLSDNINVDNHLLSPIDCLRVIYSKAISGDGKFTVNYDSGIFSSPGLSTTFNGNSYDFKLDDDAVPTNCLPVTGGDCGSDGQGYLRGWVYSHD